MTIPLRVFSLIGILVLLSLSGAAAYASLKSCALQTSFLSHLSGCPSAAEIALKSEIEAQQAKRLVLQHQVVALEQELAARQCTAVLPSTQGALTFDEQDLTALYGCWSLGSSYQTRDVDSDKIISYPTWRMCFDAKGQGRQVMQGDDGSVCEGPVQARFEGATSLILGEAGNLTCSDGGYIHRRDIRCTRGGQAGPVSCATLQPETKGEADVPLTRWQ